jgi:hypothetical protein
MSPVEHGFFGYDEANEFCTLANFGAPTDACRSTPAAATRPSASMHGLELQLEAVRQIRGQSTAQVPARAHRAGRLGPDGDSGPT